MNKYADKVIKEICKLHDMGFSPTVIAKQLNTYNTTIRRILLKNNHILKTPSEVQRIIRKNPFISLDNKALYWIGFISADGNLSDPSKGGKYTIDVSVAEQDKEHLKKYSLFLGYGVKPKNYYNKKYNSYLWSLRFGNKEIHQYLNSLGITPNKSKTLELNINISWPMLSGILDGDGCVRTLPNNRAMIEIASGSKKFITQINSFLKNNNIHHTITASNINILRICTQKDVINFSKEIYSSNNQFLQRKYEKLGPSIIKIIDEHTAKSGKPKSKDKAIPS